MITEIEYLVNVFPNRHVTENEIQIAGFQHAIRVDKQYFRLFLMLFTSPFIAVSLFVLSILRYVRPFA